MRFLFLNKNMKMFKEFRFLETINFFSLFWFFVFCFFLVRLAGLCHFVPLPATLGFRYNEAQKGLYVI